jgi:hypothetical protein
VATIDFDEIEEWGPLFEQALMEIAPANLSAGLARMQPEFVEDAATFVIEQVGRVRIIEQTSRRSSVKQ